MPKVSYTIVEWTKTFRASWRELASDATFAGMTLAEFEVASAAPLTLCEEIAVLETKLDG